MIVKRFFTSGISNVTRLECNVSLKTPVVEDSFYADLEILDLEAGTFSCSLLAVIQGPVSPERKGIIKILQHIFLTGNGIFITDIILNIPEYYVVLRFRTEG